jgi:2-polyprenyl-3-methyl-5-hydroxy-6-metoxy-1,4-benzoquinol methylase
VCAFDHRDFDRAKESILWHGDWAGQTAHVVRVMTELGLARSGLRVLDFGCGVGRVAAALLAWPGVQIRAVDSSAWMLRHAARYLNALGGTPEVELSSDYALWLEDPREAFDLVILVEVVQHIPEPELCDILPRLAPMLTPGGRVFIYGNEKLDVDAHDRLTTTTVREAIARHLAVINEQVWPDAPQPRFSLVCTPKSAAAHRQPSQSRM